MLRYSAASLVLTNRLLEMLFLFDSNMSEYSASQELGFIEARLLAKLYESKTALCAQK